MLSSFVADGSTAMTSINTALTEALSSTANDAMGTIGDVLPIVLPVLGAIVVVFVGVKLFKRFAKG